MALALALGYATPRAFIAVFKHELGITPARHAQATAAHGASAPRLPPARRSGGRVSR